MPGQTDPRCGYGANERSGRPLLSLGKPTVQGIEAASRVMPPMLPEALAPLLARRLDVPGMEQRQTPLEIAPDIGKIIRQIIDTGRISRQIAWIEALRVVVERQ